jgi:hypothetical protein
VKNGSWSNKKPFFSLMKTAASIITIIALAQLPAGCVNENSNYFPSINNETVSAGNEYNQQEINNNKGVSEIGDEKIIFDVAAPFSVKTLNRLRLLFLAKYSLQVNPFDSVKIGNFIFDRFSDSSWLLTTGQTTNFSEKLWSEYDNKYFQLNLYAELSDSGPDREMQTAWLEEESGPDIFFGSDASVYFERGRLPELNRFLFQNSNINSEKIHTRMLDAFQDGGKIYGLPAFVSYPVIMQLNNDHTITLPEGQAVWSWQLILDDLVSRCQVLNENTADTGQQPDNPSQDTGDDENLLMEDSKVIPCSLVQPWITYMQLAMIPDQVTSVWTQNKFVISSSENAINQKLFSSWQNLLDNFPAIYGNISPDDENEITDPTTGNKNTAGLGIGQYEEKHDQIYQLLEDKALIAWLGDSGKVNGWKAAVPDLSANSIPANLGESGSRYSIPLNPRGWFISDTIIKQDRRPDLAAAFISFMSSDPDAFYIIAQDDGLTGLLPTITDRDVWQTYLKNNQYSDLSYNQWQEVIVNSFTNRDILFYGWSEKLAAEINNTESRWYNQDVNPNSEEQGR